MQLSKNMIKAEVHRLQRNYLSLLPRPPSSNMDALEDGGRLFSSSDKNITLNDSKEVSSSIYDLWCMFKW